MLMNQIRLLRPHRIVNLAQGSADSDSLVLIKVSKDAYALPHVKEMIGYEFKCQTETQTHTKVHYGNDQLSDRTMFPLVLI